MGIANSQSTLSAVPHKPAPRENRPARQNGFHASHLGITIFWSSATGMRNHVVQVQKLGHIEAENTLVAEEIAREFQRQFHLSYPGRPEKQERPERLPGGLQSKLAAFENRANAGNDSPPPNADR
jgi:hypothetical protein